MAFNPPVSTNIITSGWGTNKDGAHYGISYPFVFLNFTSKSDNKNIRLTHEIMEFNHDDDNDDVVCEQSLAIVDSVKEV